MLKIISLTLGAIVWTTVYSKYQVAGAVALEYNSNGTQNQILQVNSGLQSELQSKLQDLINHNNNQGSAEENLTKILVLAGLISGGGIIGWQLSRQRPSRRLSPSFGKTSSKALIDRVSPKLRRQLLRLINDPKTANRLLIGIHQHHRDRDPDWLAEKVIYDLRRGR
ncbi:MAG: hypothetical protein RLZZ04_967 [Cyanobacteriota bacterium]|jgi:hypothetical protein